MAIPMIMHCPGCGERHIDRGIWKKKEHHTHACQSCGMVWRPAIEATVGVQFLPGFKNKKPAQCPLSHSCRYPNCTCETERHEYFPSSENMGDCAICGQVRSAEIHKFKFY